MFKIRVEENIQKKKHSEIEGVKVVYRIFVFQLKKDFAQKIKKRFCFNWRSNQVIKDDRISLNTSIN